jgi:glucosylceramidase
MRPPRTAGVALLLVVVLAGCGRESPTEPITPPPPPTPLPEPDVRVALNGGTRHQTMVGFGGDVGPWHIQGLARSDQEQLVRAAVEDLGVNVVRMNLVYHEGASASDFWGRNDDADPDAIQWPEFDFCTRPGAACNDDWQWLLPLMRQYGLDGEYLGLIQGPRWNGFDGGSSFSVEEMVENQVAALMHLRDDLGITVRWLAPFSEPGGGGIDWPISTAQARSVVRELGARLEANGFDIRMLIPDATNVRQSIQYAQAILADDQARRHVGAIGYHPYQSKDGGESPNPAWITLRGEIRALGQTHGLPVRMTEYATPRGLLQRANHIYNELEYANSTTYHAQHVFTSGEHDDGSGRDEGGGILFFETDGGGRLSAWGPTRFTGVAIGHYARFARPGSERIGATSDDPALRVQAFVDASDRRLSVVAINNGTVSRRVELTLSGATVAGLVEAIDTAESDGDDAYWTPLDTVQQDGSTRVQFIARPRSVTSLAFGM